MYTYMHILEQGHPYSTATTSMPHQELCDVASGDMAGTNHLCLGWSIRDDG